MPKILTDCINEVQAKINAGKLPKGSSAWGICIDRLRSAGLIKKAKGRHWMLTPKGRKHG